MASNIGYFLEKKETGLFLCKTDQEFNCLLISKSAESGDIYPLHLPKCAHRRIFGTISSDVPNPVYCMIVVCNSGEVFAIDSLVTMTVVAICFVENTVKWAGSITVDGSIGIVLICRDGSISLGIIKLNKESNSLQQFEWLYSSLPLHIVCCVAVEGHLIVSDGNVTHLVQLKRKPAEISTCCKRLKYRGIINIDFHDEKIQMHTLDGRLYEKMIKELKDENELEEEDIDTSLFVNLSMKETIESLKEATEKYSQETKTMIELNDYLEQISLAQSLLNGSIMNLFSLDIKALPVIENDQFYIMEIELLLLSDSFKLKSNWWQVNLHLETCSSVSIIADCMGELQNYKKLKLCIKVPFRFVQDLLCRTCNKTLYLMCNLIFLQHNCSEPVCAVHICKHPVDLLHFMFPHQQLSCCNVWENILDRVLDNLSNPISEKQFQNTQSHVNYQSFILVNESDVLPLKQLLDCNNENLLHENHTLWLGNVPVRFNVTPYASANNLKIQLESSNQKFVFAVKYYLELRILDWKCLNTSEEKLSIPEQHKLELAQKAVQVKQILDFGTSGAKDLSVLTALFDSVSQLISNVPL